MYWLYPMTISCFLNVKRVSEEAWGRRAGDRAVEEVDCAARNEF
jgi:hypothetical protein